MTQSKTYLENQILTATPQRLRLMLIQGAIRFARAVQSHWREGDAPAADVALLRCQAIIGELVRSVRAEQADCERLVDHIRRDRPQTPGERQREIERLLNVGRDTTAIYLILLRDLNEAMLVQDASKIDAVLRVLEIERETAQLVCEQLPDAPLLDLPADEEISAGQAAHILAAAEKSAGKCGGPTYGTQGGAGRSSVSFDA